MTLPPRLGLIIRRTLVTTGVMASLVLGAVTVRAAAAWTASNAPMEAPPVSASDLSSQLGDQQARSAAIEQQIADLTSRSADLATALDQAQAQVGTDTSTAKSLRAQLAAAQKKLAALSKALHAATTTTTTRTRPPAPNPPPTETHEPGDD